MSDALKPVFRTRWASFRRVASTRSSTRWPVHHSRFAENQTYALCASARCNVYDGVTYCQCDVKHSDSISLPFPMGNGKDICSVNAAGADNNYMISTYSLPEAIASPQGDGAVYTCSGKGSGAYAQCDGGICFRSTEDTTFPGFDKPVKKGQIVCSCPITQAKSGDDAQAYQILRALSLRQVLLPVLQGRHRHQQNGFDDLCRRSGWHGSGSGGPAQRQGRARQRVS